MIPPARAWLLCTCGLFSGLCAAEPTPTVSLEPLPPAALAAAAPRPDLQVLDLTQRADDLWERLRRGFAMPDLGGELVAQRQLWYLNHPASLRTMLERSRPYLHHIVEALEKRGMPTELALLPMVESAFNPMALSPAKASGLWQFIPSTGRDFNLTQNWWVDERRDVIASTAAALDYLQAIYELHGDWHLALASYNWGENAVARAIARNRAADLPTDYASLQMPAETRQYVPKLQALKNIIANPDLFDLQLPDIPNQAFFETVECRQGMDVALAAQLAEMSLEQFKALNPSFNRPVIPGGARTLVLPARQAEVFRRNLAEHDRPLLSWKTYTLERGARLEHVARHLGVVANLLAKANGLAAGARLAAGYTLLVPGDVPQDLLERDPPAAGRKLAPVRRAGAKTSTVKLAKNQR